jgi:hypothetical protein
MADDDKTLTDYLRDFNEAARYYLGPHAYQGLQSVGELANFFGPQADVAGAVESSQATMESAREGDIPGTLTNAAYTAISPIGLLIPGTVQGYRSTVQDALAKLPQETGTGPQMRAMLEKAGAKQNEIEESGLSSLLQNPKVTKEEIEQNLGQKLREVVHEADTGTALYNNSGLVLPGGSNYKEILIRGGPTRDAYPSAEAYNKAIDEQDARGGPFVGNHWDEINVLAHLRTNERTTTNGRKTLFVEEIQSDLHQKGRKVGYKTPEDIAIIKSRQDDIAQISELNKQMNDLQFYFDVNLDQFDINPDQNPVPYNLINSFIKLSIDKPDKIDGILTLAVDSLQDIFDNESKQNFFKQIFMDGREIAGLRNKIEDLRQQKLSDDKFKQADKKMPDLPLKKNWHETAFRRAVAEAVDTGADSVTWTPGQVQGRRYADDPDRTAGMIAFYDEKVKNYANKFGKKYGVTVGTEQIPLVNTIETVWSLPITDEMRKEIGEKGISMYKAGGSVVSRDPYRRQPRTI